ncbi:MULTISPECIES: hypothetical protein [Xanthomonas]|uniref:Uncharacterized protein n=1 Tax=Xanthomonas euvesicatoria TaxID=456327 RepID=A0AAW3U286_XANEU|nr:MULTISPECIES: hypothetical protein [Xanthomonas]CAD2254827.1 hypothetical protein X12_001200 [Xanthomonas arboricola]MBB4722639.1 hypothetical protein [Xanthomonas euvesicatoria]MBB4869232.1 hypothetical protein [Xanthomonas euvesicatoria]MCC8538642.1 hypothetical protein [Xanthomonas codiaei]MDN0222721.1 hypothetical protein [Xanthomonas arboricola pv. juglandis]
MLFLTIVAWFGVAYFTLGWTVFWAFVALGLGRQVKVKLFNILAPAMCWCWLIAGWVS